MPAQSNSQKKLMCLALAVKTSKLDADKFPQAAKVAKGMTVEQLREYCPEEK